MEDDKYSLLQEIANLKTQLDTANKDLQYKCEIIAELEMMIITTYEKNGIGTNIDAATAMGMKLATIHEKYKNK